MDYTLSDYHSRGKKRSHSGKRVVIFVSYSGQGGVERVVNLLSRDFLERGVKVDLLTPRITVEHLEDIPPGVNIVHLKARHTYTALCPLARYLRRERPDAVLAVKHRAIVTAVLAGILSGFKGRIVGNIHTTVSAGLVYSNFMKRFFYLSEMRVFYRLAHAIVGVSRGVAEDIKDITGLDSERVKAIHDPVVTPEIFEQGRQPLDHPWFSDKKIPVILGIGRLTKQKDFHTLINAFAQVRKTHVCRLVILGDGSDLDSLRSLAVKKGVQDDTDFPGFQKNPYAYLSRASLFVLSSRWEGFGMVIVEALALGIPVVSTDCPNGPSEILKDGLYGPLVPVEDPDALAEVMIRTLNDPLPSEKLELASRDYTTEKISKDYLHALLP
jgi:glycosyltransferase involved in cell wall biosynthesis